MTTKKLRHLAYTNKVKNIAKSEESSEFCKRLFSHKNLLSSHVHKTDNEAVLIGKALFVKNIYNYCGINMHDYSIAEHEISGKIFKKCIYLKTVFHSIEYDKSKKTNNTIIQLRDTNEIAIICNFVLVRNVCYVAVKVLKVEFVNYYEIKFSHMFRVLSTQQHVMLVTVDKIMRKLVVVDVEHERFVSYMPNNLEIQ